MRKLVSASVGITRTTWLRLLAGVGLLLGLAMPAHAVVNKHASAPSRSSAARSASQAGAPKCSYVSYDPSPDATDLEGRQANQLDLVQTTLGLNKTHTKLRLVMTVKNLSKTIPSPANYMDYQFSWSNPSGDSGPNALDVSVTRSGVTFTAGSLSGSIYTPSTTTTATGKFGHGPGGAIEVDAPLKELGLRLGQVLSSPVANTFIGVTTPLFAFGHGADSDTGSRYKVGQPTCIDRGRHR